MTDMLGNFSYSDWIGLGAKKRATATSPFFSRSYAGFTHGQMSTIASRVQDDTLSIFDPMAGQAYGISSLTWLGHDVWLNDYNPALMLLAWLRSRKVMEEYDELKNKFIQWLRDVDISDHTISTDDVQRVDFHDGWLASSTQKDLSKYGQELGIFDVNELLRNEENSRNELFKLAAVVLAARRLSIFSRSDNITWLKPGGLLRTNGLKAEIEKEIDELTKWRAELLSKFGENLFQNNNSSCHFSAVRADEICLNFACEANIVICSPPYANRLDYSAMWAPELKVLEAVGSNSISKHLKDGQVATNVIRGRKVKDEQLDILSKDVKDSLLEVLDSTEYASKSYYFPYFANFCIDLHFSILTAARSARSAQRWLVFIRDTTRKDTLIESHKVIEHVLEESGYRKTIDSGLGIVRNHIGVSRKGYAKQTLHGLAQREWSLNFVKKDGINEI